MRKRFLVSTEATESDNVEVEFNTTEGNKGWLKDCFTGSLKREFP